MDSFVPIEKIQDASNDYTQVMAGAMSTPLILREVLQHFSTTELLQLSFVNKLWNYEARSVLKDRGKFTAKIELCLPELENLQKFTSDFQQMIAVPFSGITLVHHAAECEKEWSVDPILEDILHRLKWKHLTIRFNGVWHRRNKCPGYVLVEKVLKNFGCALETLSLKLSYKREEFIESFLQGVTFSRLKTLRLLDIFLFTQCEKYTNLIKALVSRAPNLQVLHTSAPLTLMGNLMEGSSALHLPDFVYSFDQIPEAALCQLRIRRMKFLKFGNDFNLERFQRVTSMLLQTSRKTLTTVDVHLMFLVPFALCGFCFENVKDIVITLDCGYSHLECYAPEILRLVKAFDFTRIFPKVDTVTMGRFESCGTQDQIDEIMTQLGNAAFQEPVADRAANIQCLNYCTSAELDAPSVQFLAGMLPHVEKLSIEGPAVPFGLIWDAWVHLKELNANVHAIQNFDSEFCGIFPPEVDELRQRDEEFLRKVNIVPVMPSIVCAKGIRSFNLYHTCSYTRPFARDPTYLLTKVTGLIAFQRCDDLHVTLTTDCEDLEEALGHMKPYASVIPPGKFPMDLRHMLYGQRF